MNATQNLIQRLLVGIKGDKKATKNNSKKLTKILNNTVFTIYKQLNKSQKIAFENVLVNNNVFTKDYVLNAKKSNFEALKSKLSDKNLSKKKHKKFTKKFKKVSSSLQAIKNNLSESYFNFTPSGKVKPITVNQAINLLEELQEDCGAVDLPSEKLAKEDQKKYKKNN